MAVAKHDSVDLFVSSIIIHVYKQPSTTNISVGVFPHDILNKSLTSHDFSWFLNICSGWIGMDQGVGAAPLNGPSTAPPVSKNIRCNLLYNIHVHVYRERAHSHKLK